MDATDAHQQLGVPLTSESRPMHLTAREAGEAAAHAGAHRLLLSHFWPGNNREASRADAQAVFPGTVLLADEDLAIRLA